jgi:hypothetical protein
MAAAEAISLLFTNNTNGSVPVSVMSNPANLADNCNATTQSQWNVTGLTFSGENFVSVQYGLLGGTYLLFTAPLVAQTLQGVLDALNTLGIGQFFVTTSGGNTFIENYANGYEFGVLNIYNSVVPQFTYNIQTSAAGGNTSVDVNFVTQLTANNPTTVSGTITTASGDYVLVGGTAETNPGGTNVSLVNLTNSAVYLSGNVASATPFGTAITVQPGAQYVLTVTTG